VRIVISERFGGFGLSPAATERLKELGMEDANKYSERDGDRSDPRLVQVVEELGDKASAGYAELVIVEIPDGVEWHIHEYDGFESVHEEHRTWASEGLLEDKDWC
jgi:hypothetical protein